MVYDAQHMGVPKNQGAVIGTASGRGSYYQDTHKQEPQFI